MFTLGQAAMASSRQEELRDHYENHWSLELPDVMLKYSFLDSTLERLAPATGSRAIDLGAGDGQVSRFLARRFGLAVVGVDSSHVSGRLGRLPGASRLRGVAWQVQGPKRYGAGTVQRLYGDAITYLSACPDNSIDLLVDACSVTHFRQSASAIGSRVNEGYLQVIAEAARVLKPGGRIIAATDVQFRRGLGADFGQHQNEFGEEEDLLSVLSTQGFQLSNICHMESWEGLGDSPWSFVPRWRNGLPVVLGVTGYVAQKH